jgi:hypothetical protein
MRNVRGGHPSRHHHIAIDNDSDMPACDEAADGLARNRDS